MFTVTSIYNPATVYSYSTHAEAIASALRLAKANYTAFDIRDLDGTYLGRYNSTGLIHAPQEDA